MSQEGAGQWSIVVTMRSSIATTPKSSSRRCSLRECSAMRGSAAQLLVSVCGIAGISSVCGTRGQLDSDHRLPKVTAGCGRSRWARLKRRRNQMKRLILGSTALAAAAFALGLTTASAQLGPGGDTAATLSPAQRAAIRIAIRDRLADEMRQRLQDRLADVADELSALTPEQRAAVRSAIVARLGEEVQGGLPDQLGQRLADRLGEDVHVVIVDRMTPEQRLALGRIIKERLGNEMQGTVADRLADAASGPATLSPAQKAAVLAAVKARLADEVRDRLGDRVADEVGQRLSGETTGSGQPMNGATAPANPANPPAGSGPSPSQSPQ
ncbi:MAG TPA: hypothetical protein VHA77_14795 [Xanthobacteraceae bacterium]|nr:hypothetical protein [Xanthobacteraceae bacterium]